MPQAVSLTNHEQQCLCHLNRAQKQGLSLKAYADAEGLRVDSLYQTKSQLKKKGLLDTSVAVGDDFLAVDLPPASGPAILRLRHPCGWEFELLVWERNGFVAWYKRLEAERFPWPTRREQTVLTLNG